MSAWTQGWVPVDSSPSVVSVPGPVVPSPGPVVSPLPPVVFEVTESVVSDSEGSVVESIVVSVSALDVEGVVVVPLVALLVIPEVEGLSVGSVLSVVPPDPGVSPPPGPLSASTKLLHPASANESARGPQTCLQTTVAKYRGPMRRG